jgi:hypothetical protein
LELVPTAASWALSAVMWLRAPALVPTAASWALSAVMWLRASELVQTVASGVSKAWVLVAWDLVARRRWTARVRCRCLLQ